MEELAGAAAGLSSGEINGREDRFQKGRSINGYVSL